ASKAFTGKTGNGPFADMLAEMDTNSGRILDEISALGIENDTIVIFSSDNGPEDTIPWRGWAGPWTGTYVTAMEGSLRVPFIIRWPGKVPADRVSNEMVHEVDLYTTLAKIGGADIPTDRAIDGLDQTAFLLGKREKSAREWFPVFQAGGAAGARPLCDEMAKLQAAHDLAGAPVRCAAKASGPPPHRPLRQPAGASRGDNGRIGDCHPRMGPACDVRLSQPVPGEPEDISADPTRRAGLLCAADGAVSSWHWVSGDQLEGADETHIKGNTGRNRHARGRAGPGGGPADQKAGPSADPRACPSDLAFRTDRVRLGGGPAGERRRGPVPERAVLRQRLENSGAPRRCVHGERHRSQRNVHRRPRSDLDPPWGNRNSQEWH